MKEWMMKETAWPTLWSILPGSVGLFNSWIVFKTTMPSCSNGKKKTKEKRSCSLLQDKKLCHGKAGSEKDLEVTKMSLKSVANRNWHSSTHFPQKRNLVRTRTRSRMEIWEKKTLLKWAQCSWLAMHWFLDHKAQRSRHDFPRWC